MSDLDRPTRSASLPQRLTYLASTMKHQLGLRPDRPDALAQGLADLALLTATELEVAQHRIAEMSRAIDSAITYLAAANPERGSDIRAIEAADRVLRRARIETEEAMPWVEP